MLATPAPARVLWLDSLPPALAWAEEALRGAGLELHACPDASDALVRLADEPWDALICREIPVGGPSAWEALDAPPAIILCASAEELLAAAATAGDWLHALVELPAPGAATDLAAAQLLAAARGARRAHVRALVQRSGSRLRAQQAEQRVDELAQQLELVLRSTSSRVVELELDHSPAAADVWFPQKSRPNEPTRTVSAWLARVHPEDRVWIEAQLASLQQGVLSMFDWEYRSLTRSGHYRWQRARGQAVDRDLLGRPTRLQLVESEIARRKRLEMLLTTLSRMVEQLAAGESLPDLLDALLQATEAHYPEALLVLWLRGERGDALECGAGPSLPAEFRGHAAAWNLDDAGASVAVAGQTRQRIVVEDVLADDRFPAERAWCQRLGLRASWSQPIVNAAGSTLGVLAAYHREPHKPGEDEIRLIEYAAHLAFIAVERWRQLEKLRQSEARLEQALWGADIGLWEMNVPERKMFFSDHWHKMLDYAPGEITSDPIELQQLVHPDDLPHLVAAFEAHAAGRKDSFESEHRLRTRQGNYRWVLDRARIVERDAAGQPVRVLGTQMEITARKRMEMELRDSQQRFQAFMDNMPAAAFIKDTSGRYVFGNLAWGRQFEVPLDRALGRTDAELFSPETAQLFQDSDRQVREKGRPLQIIESPRGEGDAARHWSVFKFPLRDAAGHELVGGFAIDVTDQVRAQRLLQDSEEQFRQMFRAHSSVMLLIDYRTADIVDANEAAVRYYGYSRQQLQSMNVSQINTLPPEVVRRAMEEARLLQKNCFRFTHRLANGEERKVEIYSSPIEFGAKQLLFAIVHDVTDRVLAEKLLQESKERFQQLAETVRLIPWEWDVAGERYTYVGPQAEEILGHALSDWLAPQFWNQHIHPDDHDRVLAFCRDCHERMDHYEIEYRILTADGRPLWVHDVVNIVRENGLPVLLRGFMIDVSQRKAADEARRVSEARLNAALESLPFEFWICDAEGRLVHQNSVAAAHWGPRQGQRLEDAGLPADAHRLWRELSPVALAGRTASGHMQYEVDGEQRFFHTLLAPIRDGEIVQGVLGVNIDVTDLRRSEERYRLLAENSTDLITRTAVNGELLYVSPSTQLITGFTPEESVGKHFLEFCAPEEYARLEEFWQELIASGRSRTIVHQLQRKEGGMVSCESMVKAIPDPATGQVRELHGITRDVTERLEAQRRLREREMQLAHMDRLNTMGQMASVLAHEINQPLYAISNFADASFELAQRVAAASPERADLLSWISLMGKQARRAGEIVRRIDHFCRKEDQTLQRFDLNDCVRDMAAMFELNARRRQVAVQFELEPNLPEVRADRILIEQVLANLIRNALEAMDDTPDHSRRLVLRSYRAGPTSVGVAVRDNGGGLPTEDRDQLFEPYFTTKADGTGMGLAICRTTIEAHAGKLWATNNPDGAGATFQFILPAELDDDDDSAPLADSADLAAR